MGVAGGHGGAELRQEFDVVCLGGGVAGTVDLLRRSLRPGGLMLIGEPYWRRQPPDQTTVEACHAGREDDHRPLPELLEQFKPVMKKIYAKHDWQEYGGAPLLGVNGYCLICHGRSEAKAIKNAIRVGKQLHATGVNHKIVDKIEKSIPIQDE